MPQLFNSNRRTSLLKDTLLNIEHEKFMDNCSNVKLSYEREWIKGNDIRATLQKIDRGILPHGSEISQRIIKEMTGK